MQSHLYYKTDCEDTEFIHFILWMEGMSTTEDVGTFGALIKGKFIYDSIKPHDKTEFQCCTTG